jgi:hypothetical protein
VAQYQAQPCPEKFGDKESSEMMKSHSIEKEQRRHAATDCQLTFRIILIIEYVATCSSRLAPALVCPQPQEF